MQKSENYRHISGLEVSYIIYLKFKQNLENFCIETVIRDDSEIQNQFCKYQALTTRLSHLKNRAKRYQVIPQDDILSPNIRPGLAVEINVPLILIEYYLEPARHQRKQPSTKQKTAFRYHPPCKVTPPLRPGQAPDARLIVSGQLFQFKI